MGELDQNNVDIVLGVVIQLVEKGTAVIMVEHHEDNARSFATRIWEINDSSFSDLSLEEWEAQQKGGEEE